MRVLKIKDYKDVNLSDPKEAIDYFIYLTEDSLRLIKLSLYFSPDKYTLEDFYNNFYQSDHKVGYLLHFASQTTTTFIDNSDSFIFDNYFFNNIASTDIEKTAKINRLIKNIVTLIGEIQEVTDKKDFRKPGIKQSTDFVKSFETNFPSYIVINGFKAKQYPYKLLLYFFGLELTGILEKITTNYIGFIKESSLEKILSSTKSNKSVSQNPFPDIFKSHEVYKNFINYTSKHIIEPYRDYSYLFQRLKKDELIHDMKHKKFIDWLYSESLIKEKDYNIFIDNAGFRSYSKSYSEERVNNFNNIFI